MFFVTIPHSGRQIPPEARWLKNIPPSLLYCDVDSFVDELYQEGIESLNIPSLVFPWHRYAVDANRLPEDVCVQTVEGAKLECRKRDLIGFHWKQTTKGDILLPQPLSKNLHRIFVEKYYNPFHESIKNQFIKFKNQNELAVYHLDLHSMPSLGKEIHADPGEERAEVVIGNQQGRSAGGEFTKIVVGAYRELGFQVKLNQPYKGGRITETYGQPSKGQHTIQVELNRKLYMDEEMGQKKQSFPALQKTLGTALKSIYKDLKNL